MPTKGNPNWHKGMDSPNPDGRPKEKTIKERIRDWFETHPDDMRLFIEHFVKENRALTWQMLEGRPPQDITSGGEKIMPVPILGYVPDNDIHKENNESDEAVENSAGGDISK